jgi:DNA transposition AAA+ family ATPase
MTTSAVQQELSQVAAQIRGYQKGRKLSDSEMLRQFAGLGSAHTYQRIVTGELDEVDAERWLREYRAVWSLIQMLEESAAEDDPIYDDLTTVLDLRQAVAAAMREKGNNRLVIVQGPSGSGKTTAALLLAAKYGARVAVCEANEIWKDNANAMLAGILRALGVRQPPIPVAEKLVATIEKLGETRVCLVIDEAHHLGPKTLNLVKSILNQTPGEIVLLAMGTLWNRLETQAYAEARQLTQNRLSERVRYDGVEVADVQRMLERRLGMPAAAAAAAAKALRQAAQSHGNMAFVKLLCRKARRLAGKGEVTPEIVQQAAQRVIETR